MPWAKLVGQRLMNLCCETTMKKILIYIPAFATLISLLVAQTPPNTGVRQFPPQSTAIKGVLVPVPREIFDTLDKFANSNWRAVQRPKLAQQRPHSDQAETALLLGAVMAEGFTAVEAEDAGEVKSVGRAVLKLARGLGVEKAALRRSRSIVEHAERGDWAGVRKEWDGVLPDVQRGRMNYIANSSPNLLVWAAGCAARKPSRRWSCKTIPAKTPSFCGNPRCSITSTSDSRE